MNRNTIHKRTIRAITAGAVGLTLLSLAALSAQAGGPGGREPSPDRAVARLTERLDLSADQQVQVRKILEESFAKHQEIRKRGHEEMEAIREETGGKLSGVLTPEQGEKLRQLREEREQRFGDCDGRPGRRGCRHQDP